MSIIALLGAAWTAGLFAFVARLPDGVADSASGGVTGGGAGAPIANGRADGVVVFTGGSERIASAIDLIDEGAGGRLLISGVHPDATPAQIADLANGDPARTAALFECCVDLGFEARTTIGNADEAAGWARANRFRSLILVTSDYHMPRAMLETRRELPDVAITPHPVYSGAVGRKGPGGKGGARINDWGLLIGEYSKFLAAYARAALPGGGGPTAPQSAAAVGHEQP